MPMYEYVCNQCSSTTEVLQKVNAEAPSACPHCNQQDTLEKVISHSSFQLKGGGWAKDLYASSKKG